MGVRENHLLKFSAGGCIMDNLSQKSSTMFLQVTASLDIKVLLQIQPVCPITFPGANVIQDRLRLSRDLSLN